MRAVRLLPQFSSDAERSYIGTTGTVDICLQRESGKTQTSSTKREKCLGRSGNGRRQNPLRDQEVRKAGVSPTVSFLRYSFVHIYLTKRKIKRTMLVPTITVPLHTSYLSFMFRNLLYWHILRSERSEQRQVHKHQNRKRKNKNKENSGGKHMPVKRYFKGHGERIRPPKTEKGSSPVAMYVKTTLANISEVFIKMQPYNNHLQQAQHCPALYYICSIIHKN